ncbi:uncharacterized protein RHIMIDRAFT_269749 [Rhizopus microsporus ATCC 52813]|uniref:Uncharacterized protein n=1 Tax=Rhizopus microsporus ATCC 52813 TaxID=1340429 RepID=A0A2G4SIT2_RHIZD|nr:uncharacterized protein RHIMIDRAFT_269749 [Rhizopus microsporus ATCC 52813]PHZ08306.1 hypothetical protein RHIMIDRAFT_269749 [Rhizopus microsporus ATCC 52813]
MKNKSIDESSLSFLPPTDDGHFMASNFDVTNALYLLQRPILQQKWKPSLKDHAQ